MTEFAELGFMRFSDALQSSVQDTETLLEVIEQCLRVLLVKISEIAGVEELQDLVE